MAWSHPDVSLEELLHLLKGFVDILILASGYQSSGSPASWDTENIKRAAQWGAFFEQVLECSSDSTDNGDSMKELDAVLSGICSGSHFPQGLKDLSSRTLSKAREFVLEHLFQSLTLGGARLNALLTAIIELDVDRIGCIDLFTEKLFQQTKLLNLHPNKRGFMIKQSDDGYSSFALKEILNREANVSCLSSTENLMDTLLEIIQGNYSLEPRIDLDEGLHQNNTSPLKVDQSDILLLWNQWRYKGLSYLLDKRTVRLLAGSTLIFSAPKDQWIYTLENLKVYNEPHHNLLEIIELAFLGLISSRWKHLIQHLLSVSCDSLPFSEQQYVLHDLRHVRKFQCCKKPADSKEFNLTEYVTFLLSSQPCIFWKLSPILVASAVSSCSNLFQMYLDNIERQLKGKHTTVSFCSCNQDGKNHMSCEVAERIWWLHMFNSNGFQEINLQSS